VKLGSGTALGTCIPEGPEFVVGLRPSTAQGAGILVVHGSGTGL
jgi:hypothetical protein